VDFSNRLNCEQKTLLEILTNYEGLVKYVPRQLAEVKILEKHDNQTTIETTIMFKTLIKKEIKQRITVVEKDNGLEAKILDGHAKDTTISISVNPQNSQTQIDMKIDLKLSLKAKILSPIIKREYKTLLTGIFAKMELDAQKVEVGK
jgi:carbon monoxide dehydrogenase subunit G